MRREQLLVNDIIIITQIFRDILYTYFLRDSTEEVHIRTLGPDSLNPLLCIAANGPDLREDETATRKSEFSSRRKVLCPRCSVTSTNTREPIETPACTALGGVALWATWNPLTLFYLESFSHNFVKLRTTHYTFKYDKNHLYIVNIGI